MYFRNEYLIPISDIILITRSEWEVAALHCTSDDSFVPEIKWHSAATSA